METATLVVRDPEDLDDGWFHAELDDLLDVAETSVSASPTRDVLRA